MLDESKLYHIVNAEKAKAGMKGYFSNNLFGLKMAFKRGLLNKQIMYSELKEVRSEQFEKRFNCDLGNFAIFYCVEE